MKFEIGFMKNGVCQSRIMDGPDAETCSAFFRYEEPTAEYFGIHEADFVKPGQPVDTVPAGWTPESVYLSESYNEAPEAIREAVVTPFAVLLPDGDILPAEDCAEVEHLRAGYPGAMAFRVTAQEAQEAQEATESESVQEAQEKPAEKPVKALRSNSKQARENIRDYIMDHYTGGSAGYDGAPEEGCRNFPEVARFIWETFQEEKRYSVQYMHRYGADWQTLFNDWCRGLPSVIDTCFCYNRPAVPEVAAILQQDEKQSSKYTETAAEDFLIYLIYREITREVK